MQTLVDLVPLLCFGYAVVLFYRWVVLDAERKRRPPPEIRID